MKQLLKTFLFLLASLGIAGAAAAQSLDKDAATALDALYKTSPAAKALGEKAKGILVFPGIKKAAVLVGRQTRKGAMFAHRQGGPHYRADRALLRLDARSPSLCPDTVL